MKRTCSKKTKNLISVLIRAFLLFVALFIFVPAETISVHAEGSKSLSTHEDEYGEIVSNEGYRGFLEYFAPNQNKTTATVERRQLVYVYAKKGEVIYFGSSVYDSQLGTPDHNNKSKVTKEDIVVESPSGNVITYDVKNNSEGADGYISTRTQELAGPYIEGVEGSESGYKPLSFTAEETGVYTFHFHSKTGSTATNKSKDAKDLGILTREDIAGGQNGFSWEVAAWDVTVYNKEENIVIDGRLFTDHLALTTNFNDPSMPVLYAAVYVVTNDGYIYKTDFNGLDPYGFIFFANNRGLLDTKTNTPAYRSFHSDDTSSKVDNAIENITKNGLALHNPNYGDTEQDHTYKIFFSEPDPELVGTFLPEAYEPTPARNFKFVGTNGEDGTHVGVGGYFTFDVDNATSATITIDMTHAIVDEEVKDYGIVTLNDTVSVGQTNSFFWDGYGVLPDGTPVLVPVGCYDNDSITVSLDTHSGEYHLPLLDAECARNGIIVERLNEIKARRYVKIDSDGTIYCENGVVINPDGTKIKKGQAGREYYKSRDDLTPVLYSMIVTDEYEDSKYNIYYDNEHIVYDAFSSSTTAADGKDHSKDPVNSQGGAMPYFNNTGDVSVIDVWTFSIGERLLATLENDINIVNDKKTMISGTVFFDIDNNGVFELSKHDFTLSGVEVALTYHPVKMTPQLDEHGDPVLVDGNPLYVAMLDSNNNYVFEDTPVTVTTTTDVTGKYYFYNIPYSHTPEAASENNCTLTITTPNDVYIVTTSNKTSNDFSKKSIKGTETQTFAIGGKTGIDPEDPAQVKTSNIVITSDVGYFANNINQKISLTKDWRIDKTFDDFRPENVTLTVKGVNSANQVAITKVVTLNEFNSWITTISNLPEKDKNSNMLKYIVTDETFIWKGQEYHYVGESKKYYRVEGGIETEIPAAEYPYKTAFVNSDKLIFGEFQSTIINAPTAPTLQITKRSTDDLGQMVKGAVFKLYKVKTDGEGHPLLDTDGNEVLEEITGCAETPATDENGLFLFRGDAVDSGEYVIETTTPDGYVTDTNKKIKVFVNKTIPPEGIEEGDKASYVYPENQLLTAYNRPIKTTVRFAKEIDYFNNDLPANFEFVIQYSLHEGYLEKLDDGEDVGAEVTTLTGKVSLSKAYGNKSSRITLTLTDAKGTREVDSLNLPSDVYIRIKEKPSEDYTYKEGKSTVAFLSQESGAVSVTMDDCYQSNEIFHITDGGTYTFTLFNALNKVPTMYFEKKWLNVNGSATTNPSIDVTCELQRSINGTLWEKVADVTLTKSGSYKYNTDGLDLLTENSDGKKYTYRLSETVVPDNYLLYSGTISYSGKTATYTNPVTEKSVNFGNNSMTAELSEFQQNYYLINYPFLSKYVYKEQPVIDDTKLLKDRITSVEGKTIKSGNSVTYMIKLNTSFSKNQIVAVTDDIPDKLILDSSSVKLYKELYNSNKYTVSEIESSKFTTNVVGKELTVRFMTASDKANYYIVFDAVVNGEDNNIINQASAVMNSTPYQSNTVKIKGAKAYLRIEEHIPQEDLGQKFIYKIEELDADDQVVNTFYTDVNITKVDLNHFGDTVIAVSGDKYRVTKVVEWSGTKYDAIDSTSKTVTIENTVNTVVFSNTETIYAYLNSQAYCDNTIQ